MVTIDNIGNGFINVTVNPSLAGIKRIIAHRDNVRITLIDKQDGYTNDIVRVFFNDKENIKLHWSVVVLVGGVGCATNEEIVDEIQKLLTS